MSIDLFPSDIAFLLYSIAIGSWLLGEIIGGKILPKRRRAGSPLQKQIHGLRVPLVIEWLVVFSVSYDLAIFGVAMLPGWVCYIGIALIFFGIAFRHWAILILGRFFSDDIGIQPGQKVVDNGPYRLIRHPSYTGILIIQLGIGLAVQSLAAMIIIVIAFGLVFGHRIAVEEKLLVSELGESYVAYMNRTKRLIPFLI